jgi:hypothetical protein
MGEKDVSLALHYSLADRGADNLVVDILQREDEQEKDFLTWQA